MVVVCLLWLRGMVVQSGLSRGSGFVGFAHQSPRSGTMISSKSARNADEDAVRSLSLSSSSYCLPACLYIFVVWVVSLRAHHVMA